MDVEECVARVLWEFRDELSGIHPTVLESWRLKLGDKLPLPLLALSELPEGEQVVMSQLRTRLNNLLALKHADSAAFTELRNRLIKRAYRMVKDWSHAQDLAHSAIQRMFESMHTFRGDSSYEAWVSKILYHLILRWKDAGDQLVYECCRPLDDDGGLTWEDLLSWLAPSHGILPPHQEEAVEREERLGKLLLLVSRELTDRYSYRAINLVYLQGMGTTTAAAVLGITTSHLLGILSKARKKLRKCGDLEALWEEYAHE